MLLRPGSAAVGSAQRRHSQQLTRCGGLQRRRRRRRRPPASHGHVGQRARSQPVHAGGWRRLAQRLQQAGRQVCHARLAGQCLQAAAHLPGSKGPQAAQRAAQQARAPHHQRRVVGSEAALARALRRHAVRLGAAPAQRAVAAAVHQPRLLLRLRLAPPLVVLVQLAGGEAWGQVACSSERNAASLLLVQAHRAAAVPAASAIVAAASLLPLQSWQQHPSCRQNNERTLRRHERRSPSKSLSSWKRPHCWQKRIVCPSTTRHGSSKW